MMILGLLFLAAILYFGIMAHLNRDPDSGVDKGNLSKDYVETKDPLK